MRCRRWPGGASRTKVCSHSDMVLDVLASSPFRTRTLVDKFVGILPEINLRETCARKVLATLAAFEVELARREGAGTRDGVQAPYAVLHLYSGGVSILGALTTKFFEELILI